MKKLSLIFLILIISSCSANTNTVDVKSPCVSTKRGPCGPKIPVNNWWIKGTQDIGDIS